MSKLVHRPKPLEPSRPLVAAVEPAVPRSERADPSRRPEQRLQAGRSGAVTSLSDDGRELLNEGLEDALAMMHSGRGNIQLVDPADGSLRIAVQAGFSDEFLEYFATVDDDRSACGRTMQQLAQTVIPDVTTDSGFAPHRDMAAASAFRAVASTPLVDQHGQLVGVLSTHYPRPYRPADLDLRLIRRFGELIGQAFEDLEAEQRAAVTRSAG